MRSFDCQGRKAFWDEREFGAAAELVLGRDGQAVEGGERFERDGSTANWANPALFVVGVSGRIEMKVYCGGGRGGLKIEVVIKTRAGVGAIETRLMNTEQFEFTGAGGFGGRAAFQRNRFDFVNEAGESAGNTIGIGVFVVGEARAKIFRLADVKDAIGRAAHDVNAGFARGGFEKLIAETLDQRSGQRE